MIAGLRPYPEMKPSGVPWLRDVPEHWTIAALRHRYEQCLGKMLDAKRISGRYLVPYLRNVDVQWDHVNTADLPLMDITSQEYDRYTLRPGDLLVCEGGEVGRCATWLGDISRCGFQKALHRLRPITPEEVPRFLYYSLRVASGSGAFTDGHESTIAHLTGDKLRAHRFAFPPHPEQTAIVRFLDHADRRIRRYIRAKQSLIKLLEEQKQAIIRRAVTRGLDPNVRLKPSGVEWLGEVPEHWEVMRLARVIRDGPRNGISPPIDEGGNLESFSISAIRDGKVDVRDQDRKYILGDRTVLESVYRLQAGDILIVRGNGNIRLVGKTGLVERDMPGRVYPDLLMRVKLTRRCVPEFLVALLNCNVARDQIEMAARTAVGTFKINNQQVRQLCFAFPSVGGQRRIVDWLSLELSTAKAVSCRADDEIILLREYRTRLIADVVTGKLDVREAAGQLPDEVDEPELLDETDAESDAEEADADDIDEFPEEAEA